jgi:DNA-directed RNA polymerase specialized sigma24 family protein
MAQERVPAGGGAFPGTRWSVLREATGEDVAARRQAWEVVAAAYWKPVYTYLRLRHRLSADEAEDVTQSFFARAVEKPVLAGYDPARARFRTSLRACLDDFVANHRRACGRLKRGGGLAVVDFAAAERELVEARPADDPDLLFHREFMRRVMEMAVGALRARCQDTPRARAFEVFRRHDLDPGDGPAPSYADLARDLGLRVTQVTNDLAAMRRALRAEVIGALRALTASPAEFEAEARALLGPRREGR